MEIEAKIQKLDTIKDAIIIINSCIDEEGAEKAYETIKPLMQFIAIQACKLAEMDISELHQDRMLSIQSEGIEKE
jgi:hypothetical protein